MKKRIIAVLVAVMLVVSGCSSKSTPADPTSTPTNTVTQEAAKPTEEVTAAPEETDSEKAAPSTEDEPEGDIQEQDENVENQPEEGNEEDPQPQENPAGNDANPSGASGISMSVNGETGLLSIQRAPKKSDSMGEPGTWTIFVYLCGTDLESSGQGSATSDIDQMLAAEGNENVKFVIQTGGTSQWINDYMSNSASERWVVTNQDKQLVDSIELSNMGDSSTLSGFLKWGVENYPAEKMGLIFWNHGAGSINGACVDEFNEGDTLSLAEINSGLAEVYSGMTSQFEFIGFDCCLMGTLETANILATYAKYFYGSQETEPGSGWDYTSIGNFLAQNTEASGADLGKIIADSFYNECAQGGQESGSTLTIVDLEKVDDLTIAFNSYAKELFTAASGSNLPGIVRGVNAADNFGGNNKSEGYTNMVDIGGIVQNCSGFADGSAVLEALSNCIVYNKNGSNHTKATGLSIFYPLDGKGTEELKTFSQICISPYYLSLIDLITKGHSDQGYTNTGLFTENGSWSNSDCKNENISEDYFDYAGDGKDEASSLLSFAVEPGVDENGSYGFQLDEKGLEYAANVIAVIYLSLEDGQTIELGETYDVNQDWETGTFSDKFDGQWLALADEQILATYIADTTDDYIVYTSPVYLNGKRTNLRILQGEEGTVVEGAWDGIDENGIPAREIKTIKAGDVIVPMYYLSDETEYKGSEYTWTEEDNLTYSYLPAADYSYSFLIDDVYGDYFTSEAVVFTIDEEGNIVFKGSEDGEEGQEVEEGQEGEEGQEYEEGEEEY